MTGVSSTCAACAGSIVWIDCPTGGWWAHLRHPDDDHDAEAEMAALVARIEALTAAILDIDAHATPLGEDDDGFVAVGYAVSVGALHRALGLVVGSSIGRRVI